MGAFDGEVYPVPEDAAVKIQAHLHRMREEGYAPVTLRNHLTVTRYYMEAQGCAQLLSQVKLPVRVKKQLTQTLLASEVTALFAALQALAPKSKQAFEILLLTGMRLSELTSLQYTHEDLAARRLLVKSPSGQPRPLFLGAKAAKLLGGFLGPRKRLPRGPKARFLLSGHLRDAALAAGLEPVTVSRLRMTYAVRMLLADHSFEFVAKNLGLSRGSYESRRRLKDILVDHLSRVPHAAS